MRKSSFKFLSVLALVCLISCGQGGDRVEIRETATRSPHRGPVRLDATSTERFGFSMEPAPAGQMASVPPQGDIPIHWEAPEGWQEVAATQFRLANFRVGPSQETECYLSVLPGGGGGVLGNVNRWRGQMGLVAYTEQEFSTLGRRALLGQDGVYVDMEGAYSGMGAAEAKSGYRMLGVLAEHAGTGIFVKMVGPAGVVAEEVENFDTFLASLHLAVGDHAHSAAAPEAPSSSGSKVESAEGFAWNAPEGFAWRAPEGWTQSGDRPMRLVTFTAGESGGTEAYITVLPGAGGGVLMNVNRWLGQFGADPLTQAELSELETVSILETSAALVEITGTFSGMGRQAMPGQSMLGVACVLEGQAVFVKMTGPESEVASQKENFVAFCGSLHRH